jgi:hypothetical protein
LVRAQHRPLRYLQGIRPNGPPAALVAGSEGGGRLDLDAVSRVSPCRAWRSGLAAAGVALAVARCVSGNRHRARRRSRPPAPGRGSAQPVCMPAGPSLPVPHQRPAHRPSAHRPAGGPASVCQPHPQISVDLMSRGSNGRLPCETSSALPSSAPTYPRTSHALSRECPLQQLDDLPGRRCPSGPLEFGHHRPSRPCPLHTLPVAEEPPEAQRTIHLAERHSGDPTLTRRAARRRRLPNCQLDATVKRASTPMLSDQKRRFLPVSEHCSLRARGAGSLECEAPPADLRRFREPKNMAPRI